MLEEVVGFEPTDVLPSSVFRTDAISRSATPPYHLSRIRTYTLFLALVSKTSMSTVPSLGVTGIDGIGPPHEVLETSILPLN